MKPNWDERYRDKDYVYGKDANVFFREWLPTFEPGTVLMPADGEGRNGVYAARLGWDVTSCDLSAEGRSKALKLAKEFDVFLKYEVGDLQDLQFEKAPFDLIGLIYAHFAADKKSDLHLKLDSYLKPGGAIIFEAFSKNNLPLVEQNPKIGGPRNIDQLFSITEIQNDFAHYEIILLEEKQVELSEGKYHIGIGSVIRFVGRKP